MADTPPKRTLIVGVDPGLKGAVALVDAETLEIELLFDMPTRSHASKARKSGKKHEVHGIIAAQILSKYASRIAFGVIEKVGAMPNQGLGSTFNFGHSTGTITGVINGLAIQTVTVAPSVWKPSLGLNSRKRQSLDLAQCFFPKDANLFKRLKDDGRAEAALIAYWAIKLRGPLTLLEKDTDKYDVAS